MCEWDVFFVRFQSNKCYRKASSWALGAYVSQIRPRREVEENGRVFAHARTEEMLEAAKGKGLDFCHGWHARTPCAAIAWTLMANSAISAFWAVLLVISASNSAMRRRAFSSSSRSLRACSAWLRYYFFDSYLPTDRVHKHRHLGSDVRTWVGGGEKRKPKTDEEKEEERRRRENEEEEEDEEEEGAI